MDQKLAADSLVMLQRVSRRSRAHRAPCATAAVGLLALAAACGENRTLPPREPYRPGDAGIPNLSCIPDLDGRLTEAELPIAFGAKVSYLVTPAGTTRNVELAGRVDADGKRVWDFSALEPADQIAMLGPSELDGKWYAATFPDGEFATPIDAGGRTDGIYRLDADGLYLLGLASIEENAAEGKTLYRYETPIAVYRLPLEVGSTWTSSGVASQATLFGLPYNGVDTYTGTVEAAGLLELPDLRFTQAHKVRLDVSIDPSIGDTITRKQVSFMSECFGEVARVTSANGETENDFTLAAEVRRLSLE